MELDLNGELRYKVKRQVLKKWWWSKRLAVPPYKQYKNCFQDIFRPVRERNPALLGIPGARPTSNELDQLS